MVFRCSPCLVFKNARKILQEKKVNSGNRRSQGEIKSEQYNSKKIPGASFPNRGRGRRKLVRNRTTGVDRGIVSTTQKCEKVMEI